MIELKDVQSLRAAVILSSLSERPFHLVLENRKVYDFEVEFLKLIQKMQNGCKIDIADKQIKFYPGIITNNNGIEIEFQTNNQRNLTYYLEPILIIALFGKEELNLKLHGITNDDIDQSVDSLNSGLINIIKIQQQSNVLFKIDKRGFKPDGIGTVIMRINPIKYFKRISNTERGLVKRVRGIACGVQVAPNILNRMVDAVRGVFNDFLPDVWIYTDLQKGAKIEGKQQGYAISINAETTTGIIITVDNQSEENNNRSDPEEIGKKAANLLLQEISNYQTVDTSNQSYQLIMMALGEKAAQRVNISRITPQTVETLRMIRQFVGVIFSIESKTHQEYTYMELACIGVGITNLSRRAN